MEKSQLDALNDYCRRNPSRTLAPNRELEDFAKGHCDRIILRKFDDAFACFASLNYLNATRGSDSIKKYLSKAINAMKGGIENVSLFLSDKRVVYVKFFNFVFSFSNVEIDGAYGDKLRANPCIEFDGIRKKPSADYILSVTMEDAGKKAPLSREPRVETEREPEPMLEAGKLIRETFQMQTHTPDRLLSDAQINLLCTTRVTAKNIASVLSFLYFSCDLLRTITPSLPSYLSRCLCRSLIIQSYSVVDALEIEIGAKLSGVVRSPEMCNFSVDKRFKKEFRKHIHTNPETSRMFNMYRDLRNNVHLSKIQSIEEDPNYDPHKAQEWLTLMQKYVIGLGKAFADE